MQVIWLKRDLRLYDHEPLQLALQQVHVAGPVLVCYFHEPSLLSRADTSAQHVGFVAETLDEMGHELRSYGSELLVTSRDAPAALAGIHLQATISHLWTHAETTHQASFERDQAVHRWARGADVRFQEVAQNAVRRGSVRKELGFDFKSHLRNATTRSIWSLSSAMKADTQLRGALLPLTEVTDLRDALVRADVGQTAARHRTPLSLLRSHKEPGWLEEAPSPKLQSTEDKPLRLSGGRSAAIEQLRIFLEPENLLEYPSAISSPLSALNHCSRLSPYLAWGVISDREVIQTLDHMLDRESENMSPKAAEQLASAARFFVERLYWRSSYLQVAEMYPSADTVAGLPAFQGLRESERMNGWLQAWAAGQTGYPMIDAGMRMLNATGWLNMRLRGTVTSFALNDLWLPWQEVGLVLAREFLDYEPAIHWNQLQIHAGVSRQSGPLTYDAVKQAREHDSSGAFVRQWVPELRGLPTEHIFEPWNSPAAVQRTSNCVIGRDYPAPLVRYPVANEAARQRVAALREGRPERASMYWKERARGVATQGQSSLFG